MDVMTTIKHRKAIYAAIGSLETNLVMGDYELAVERARDIIRSLEALRASEVIDYSMIREIINTLNQIGVQNEAQTIV